MSSDTDTDIYSKYREVCDAVLSHGMYGRRHGIDIMRDLLVKYGHPERGFRIVHIAGTNGKGSTAYYTAGMLAAAGRTVGLYTSPHLAEVTERIRVNGEEIPQEDFARIAAPFCEEKEATASDVLLLAALAWFRERNCEYAVIETGLGGAFDSTNALTDEDMGGAAGVSVITNIGPDHTAVLGDTLAEIAEAKAGILKRGTRAVLAEMPDEALRVLTRRCEELGIPYTEVGQQNEIDAWLMGRFPKLARTYQRGNIANAVAAVRALGLVEQQAVDLSSGLVVGADNAFWQIAERGIANTVVPGRLQVLRCETGEQAGQGLGREICLIVDGAHNPQGAKALAESLAALYPGEKFDCIVGIVRDKDAVGILEPLLPLMNTATIVAVGEGERKTDADGLCRWIAERGIPVAACGSAQEAVERQAGWVTDDLLQTTNAQEAEPNQANDAERKILTFGSLYLVGEILKYYKSINEPV